MGRIGRRLLLVVALGVLAYDLARLRLQRLAEQEAEQAEAEQAWRQAEAEGFVVRVRPTDGQ